MGIFMYEKNIKKASLSGSWNVFDFFLLLCDSSDEGWLKIKDMVIIPVLTVFVSPVAETRSVSAGR